METVEIVIKLSKEDYKDIKDDVKKFLSMPAHKVPVLYEAVDKGILLPKGRGRLIDVNDLCIAIAARMFNIKATNSISIKDLQDVIDNALTIIEADKDGE